MSSSCYSAKYNFGTVSTQLGQNYCTLLFLTVRKMNCNNVHFGCLDIQCETLALGHCLFCKRRLTAVSEQTHMFCIVEGEGGDAASISRGGKFLSKQNSKIISRTETPLQLHAWHAQQIYRPHGGLLGQAITCMRVISIPCCHFPYLIFLCIIARWRSMRWVSMRGKYERKGERSCREGGGGGGGKQIWRLGWWECTALHQSAVPLGNLRCEQIRLYDRVSRKEPPSQQSIGGWRRGRRGRVEVLLC